MKQNYMFTKKTSLLLINTKFYNKYVQEIHEL